MFSSIGQSAWYALSVQNKAELRVGGQLRAKSLEVFLPTVPEVRKWSDRWKKVDAPLFPGYLFCQLTRDERLIALQTSGVKTIVGVGTQPVPVAPAELEAVYAAIHSGLPLQALGSFAVGQQVRVIGGPLRGILGTLLSVKGTERFVVSVSLLQRSVAVEIDSNDVIPIGNTQLARAAVPR